VKVATSRRFELSHEETEAWWGYTAQRIVTPHDKACDFAEAKSIRPNFYLCTMHSDIYVVCSPTNALFIKLRKVWNLR